MVLKFIVTFLGVYTILSIFYGWYLNWSKTSVFHPDFITYYVAKYTEAVLSFLGLPAFIETVDNEAWVRLYYNNTYVVRIIEGCNAVSVIILFVAFVIAFSSSFKRTVLFLAFGSFLIYIANVLRIALLTIGLYHYPNYEHVLHGVVFPLFIYGMVFLLWVIWVNRVKDFKTLNENG